MKKLLLFLLLFSAPAFAAPKEPLPYPFQNVRLVPQGVVGVGTAQRFQSTPTDLTRCAPGDVEFNTLSGIFRGCTTTNTWTTFSTGGTTAGTLTNTAMSLPLGDLVLGNTYPDTVALPAPSGDQIVNNLTATPGTALPAWQPLGSSINTQSGATYTVNGQTDRGNIIRGTQTGTAAYTLPQAGTTNFNNGLITKIINNGTDVITVTPTTSTINGASSLAIPVNGIATIMSDNVNYYAELGGTSGGGSSCSGTAGNLLYTPSGTNCSGLPNSTATSEGSVTFAPNLVSHGGVGTEISASLTGTGTSVALIGSDVLANNETADNMSQVIGQSVFAAANDGGGSATEVDGEFVQVGGGAANGHNFGVHIADMPNLADYSIRTGVGLASFGPGPDIDPGIGAGEAVNILHEDLGAAQVQGLHINTEVGASASGGSAAGFASFDAGINDIQGLSVLQTIAEHQSSGTVGELMAGVEAGVVTDMGSGAATTALHFVVDSPILNSAVSTISGLEVQDLCGVGAGTVAATACTAVQIDAQTSPGKAITVAGGVSSFKDIQISGVTAISATAPSVAAGGCGGSGASITHSNGTALFTVNVGTSNTGTCTITMPTATTDWGCGATDITTTSANVAITKSVPGGTPATQITLQNYTDVMATHAWTDSDKIQVRCMAE